MTKNSYVVSNQQHKYFHKMDNLNIISDFKEYGT